MNNENNYTGASKQRVIAGSLIIAAGVLFFLKQAGLIFLPFWLFSWPMILILAGVVSGIKNNFSGKGWIILLALGGFFLANSILKVLSIHLFSTPLLLILIGVLMIRRPAHRHHHCSREWRKMYYSDMRKPE